jgi:hypothetical protein
MAPSKSTITEQPSNLDPVSGWRALQALSVIHTVMLNCQIQKHSLLEHRYKEDRPLPQHLGPVLLLESVPTINKPKAISSITTNQSTNPFNPQALTAMKTKVRHLHARVEKEKKLASEIERRMQMVRIRYPTHSCHSCIQNGESVEILLTKCGHRVCRTCLSFEVRDNGLYECSICFAPAQFVAASPLNPLRSGSAEISSTFSQTSFSPSSNNPSLPRKVRFASEGVGVVCLLDRG